MVEVQANRVAPNSARPQRWARFIRTPEEREAGQDPAAGRVRFKSQLPVPELIHQFAGPGADLKPPL